MSHYLSRGLLALWLFTVPLHLVQAQSPQAEKLRRKAIEWGTNKPVTAQLKTGEKLKGRIADIKDDLFAVQLVDKDKVVARELRYSDVDKISAKDGGKAGKIAGYTALGVPAGVGVVFLIVLGVWARN
jgi:hypothetical protein